MGTQQHDNWDATSGKGKIQNTIGQKTQQVAEET